MVDNRTLDGRVAVITGGARGQGRAHALELASRGADIVVCDLGRDMDTIPYSLGTAEELQETRDMVEQKAGRRCITMTADVRQADDMARVAARALDEFGKIDILVANAGVMSYAPFSELSAEVWDEMIAVNLTGVFHSTQAVLPSMLERGHGRIIAIASMAGRAGVPNLAHYTAAKWGVIGLMKSLSLEVSGKGITANAVCPANVDTYMIHNPAAYRLFAPHLDTPDRDTVRSIFERLSPMGVPWVDSSDISAAVAFLASDEARYLSGTTIDVAAGNSAIMP